MTDLLPPGNVPAWADGDPANQIAQIWQGDMWPALWPKMVFNYANAAARDADLTGLGPTDPAFAWLADVDVLTFWDGAAWKAATPKTGSTVLTFVAGVAVLNHNLGIIPTVVHVNPRLAGTFVMVTSNASVAPTTTTLGLRAFDAAGAAWAGAATVYWSVQ